MPLDAQLVPLCNQLNALPPMSSLSPADARDRFRQMSLLAAQLAPAPEVAAVEDLEVPGAAGPLRARIYRPPAEGPVPTLVFAHGGGFVIGDIDSYDAQCRLLCHSGGVVVLAFEYRLAPEAPFPAPVDDAVAAVSWALDNAGELGGDPGRVAVGGDSAGGNLAAVAAQELRGHEPAIAAQLLLYPVTDFASERPSLKENGEGLFLTEDDMRWFEAQYLAAGDPRDDPRTSPLLAEDLSGLPSAIVITAELDPLRDDGEAYAQALEEAGVPVLRRRYDGLVHGFFAMGPVSAAAKAAADEVCSDLREILA